MKVKTNFISIFIFGLLAFISCNTKTLAYAEYLKYIANEENGLVKEKTVTGVSIKVKYLPADYLVYNALKLEKDSITANEIEHEKKEYSNSITFMLTIGPAKGETFDITRVGLQNYEEFAERIQNLSFNMKEYITLKADTNTYYPQLVQLETINTKELSKNLIVVFNDDNGKSLLKQDITFIYNDEMFRTGINKFVFESSDLNAIPKLIFEKD